ncbi:MAG: L-aspartate/L-glutamate decarboxylase [Promethearchaeota archaeon]|nr:MAG: L-aspartate/L-glutamate decarboxylase [Candidatus Lokiarchaeota archaeon]
MIEKEGVPQKELLEVLEKKLSKDYEYYKGNILGSMCTSAHTFGREVYCKYVNKNLGDPGLFPGTSELEEEVVKEIGELFHGENIMGSFTTGGSEANLIAVRIAKELRPEVEEPEVVLPVSAHMSFDKAADLLGITLRKARLLSNFQLDEAHYRSLINDNTVGAVAVAGTTSLGLVDPIEEIGKMIQDKDIFFHIDAAFGGFVLPFLEKTGEGLPVPKWDFHVEQVDSITADPHKMGMNVIPSGGIFLRNEQIIQKTGFEIPYLAGGNFKHLHIVGTRPGGPVISFWALMHHLGMNGFKKVVNRCMENTQYLSEQIKTIEGINLATNPLMNIVGITTHDGQSICELDKELRMQNWMLGKFEDFNLIRIVLMPHITKIHLSKFVGDLKKVVKKLEL